MALRRSNDPLTGELRVPFRCVAPSRSSLNAGYSLLFLIIALCGMLLPCRDWFLLYSPTNRLSIQ